MLDRNFKPGFRIRLHERHEDHWRQALNTADGDQVAQMMTGSVNGQMVIGSLRLVKFVEELAQTELRGLPAD
jgi:hypothetical protein